MENYNYIIDFDFGDIRIYKYNAGIVLCEPAIGIVSKKSKFEKVIQCGNSALKYLGKLDKEYKVIYPIEDAKIVDVNICAQLVNLLFEKIEDAGFRKRRDIVILAPCGLNKQEIQEYQNLGFLLSAKNVRVVTKVQAISKYNTLKNKLANMVVHMGDDYLDIAVVYDHRILKGYTVNLGTNQIKQDIANYLEVEKSIEVRNLTLRRILDNMATILPNDDIEEKYDGVDVYSKTYMEFWLSSLNIYQFYNNYIGEVCDIIDTVMKSLSKEVIAELKVSGILLSGKLAKITGLKRFLKNRLGMEVNISDKYEFVSLLGAATMLNDIDLLDSLSVN